MKPDSIPLRAYRIAPRKPRIDLESGWVILVVPTYFGNRPWRIPVSVVGINDSGSDPASESDHGPLFAQELKVPYLATTSDLTNSNVELLFREPQRIPPLRVWIALASNIDMPIGWLESRSERGGTLDGVRLRAVDPAEAIRKLLEMGAERVADPDSWLARTRRTVQMPVERERLIAHRRRMRGLTIASAILLLGGAVSSNWTLDARGIAWLWSVAAVAAGIALEVVRRRAVKRRERNER